MDAETIITKFVAILEEVGSSETVSFREIARRIGCNHTNLYNYFESFEDLRAQSLIFIAQSLRKRIVPQSEALPPETLFRNFIHSLAEWAVSNAAIYRILWIDKMPAEASMAVFSVLPRPENAIMPILEKLAEGSIHTKKLQPIAAMVHSYFHGEILKMICNRHEISVEEFLEQISGRSLDMARSLLGEHARNVGGL